MRPHPGPQNRVMTLANSTRWVKSRLPGIFCTVSQRMVEQREEAPHMKNSITVGGTHPHFWNTVGRGSMPGPETLFTMSTMEPKVVMFLPPIQSLDPSSTSNVSILAGSDPYDTRLEPSPALEAPGLSNSMRLQTRRDCSTRVRIERLSVTVAEDQRDRGDYS